MKAFVLFFSFLLGSASFAAQDSVAVFFNPEKSVVLINEEGVGRLQGLMDHLAFGNELHILNPDESIKIDCGRTTTTASCTFRFLPSATVQFGPKTVTAEITGVEGSFEASFESSRGNKFLLQITDGKMSLKAQKTK